MCDLRLETPRFTGSTTIIPHFRLIGLGELGSTVTYGALR